MNSRSSNSDSPAPLPDFITVGKIRKPHGVRGEVVVGALSDVRSRFTSGSLIEIVFSDDQRRRVAIESVRGTDREPIVRFAGIETRDQAEALRGASLEIERSQVPAAPAGSYYFFELVGCECYDAERGRLGRVVGLLEDGGGLILEVRDGSKRLLVPFVEVYLADVQTRARRIDLQLPKGLIETCTSEF